MILDVLENSARYEALNPHFAAAFAFLRLNNLADLPIGRNEIGGDDIYAMAIKMPGRKPEEGLIETHDKYIDIQVILSGVDAMGWKARKDLGQPTEASDPHKDVAFYADAPDAWTVIEPGKFVIFFPEDGHLPSVSDGDIHKVVIKVRA